MILILISCYGIAVSKYTISNWAGMGLLFHKQGGMGGVDVSKTLDVVYYYLCFLIVYGFLVLETAKDKSR